MAIAFLDKSVKDIWYGNKKVKEVWYSDKKVWPNTCSGFNVSSNTIAYYPLKTDWNDHSGNGKHISLSNNSMSDSPGFFPGTSSCKAQLPSIIGYKTMSFWVSAKRWNYMIFSHQSSDWYLFQIQQRGSSQNNGKNNNYDSLFPDRLELNRRYHFVFTQGDGNIKLYLNGEMYDSKPYSTFDRPLTNFGCGKFWNSYYLHGNVSELIIENKTWNNNEIKKYYNCTKDDYTTPLHWYSLETDGNDTGTNPIHFNINNNLGRFINGYWENTFTDIYAGSTKHVVYNDYSNRGLNFDTTSSFTILIGAKLGSVRSVSGYNRHPSSISFGAQGNPHYNTFSIATASQNGGVYLMGINGGGGTDKIAQYPKVDENAWNYYIVRKKGENTNSYTISTYASGILQTKSADDLNGINYNGSNKNILFGGYHRSNQLNGTKIKNLGFWDYHLSDEEVIKICNENPLPL